jgi:hypothetical protein
VPQICLTAGPFNRSRHDEKYKPTEAVFASVETLMIAAAIRLSGLDRAKSK